MQIGISDIVSIVALIIATVSFYINYLLSKKLAALQSSLTSKENNRLNLANVRKELTELAFDYDIHFEKAISLGKENTDLETAKTEYEKSCQTLGKIIHLYERSKTFISKESRLELDELLSILRKDDELEFGDSFYQLIKFVQLFDKTIEKELNFDN